jgi:alkylation response protein AidB-like acyl-CoA dehydrogenase
MGRLVHPGPFLSSAVGAVSAVVALGSDDDKRALLPPLADGTTVATLALLEAGSHGDWRRVSCQEAQGSLTGTKVHVPDAMAADTFLVSARGPGGIGLYAVDRDAPGVSVSPAVTVDPTRLQGTLCLDAAPARRLGSGDALGALQTVMDRVLIGLVVDGVGAAEQALGMAVAYAKERTQFDRVIGSFQAVQHLCTDMLQDLELGRAGAYYGLWAADSAPPEELHRAATMAKAYSGDAFFRVGAGAIQVLGGIGYTWEHDAHLFYKRLLTLQQAYGTSSDHLEELARLIV